VLSRHVGAALCIALLAIGWETASAARGDVDPIGTWSCVVWGHPEFGDERVLMSFAPQGVARLARIENVAVPSWSGLTPWIAASRELTFSDPRTGRQYTADLRRDNLGGTWRTLTATGGWWCAVSDVEVVPETVEERAEALPPVLPLVPPLLAIVAAAYPVVWGAGQLLTGWLSDHIGRKPLIVGGMLAQAAALVLLVAGGGALAPSLAAALVLGAGTAMVYPTLIAAVSDATQPRDRARVIGVYRFWRDFGFVAGAIVSGVAADAAV
jgi:hypothetical protein